MNVLDLCAGIGGFSLGIRAAVPEARTVCYVEREAFACSVLVAQMEAGRLDPAPIWTDLRTLDGRPWRGVVDLVTAGFPCQPHSFAGKRRGVEDERWLFDDILRIIEEVSPTYVFLENVPGLRTSGLHLVLQGLSGIGFDAEWDVFSAAEVGAPHLRKRLFILGAHPDRQGESQSKGGEQGQRRRTGDVGEEVSHPDRGLPPRRNAREDGGPTQESPRRSSEMAHSDDEGSPVGKGKPGNHEQERSSPVGDGWWAAESEVGRVVDGFPGRVDQLRALGNAVIPLVVTHAWRELTSRLTESR